jgi:hypothetical protein
MISKYISNVCWQCDESTCKDSTCSCEECHEMKEEVLEERVQTSVVARKHNCGTGNKVVDLELRTLVDQPGVVHRAPPEELPAACQSCQSAQRTTASSQRTTASSLTPSWTSRCSSQQSHDCGYSSEGNDTISGSCSLPSSPEGSEVACSDGFCNHEGMCKFFPIQCKYYMKVQYFAYARSQMFICM